MLAPLIGCGGSDLVLPNETGPAELALIKGDGQTGPAGQPLTDSLAVKVSDRRGQPLAHQRVAFALDPQAPGALISPDTAATGDDGIAQARWVLGGTSGNQTAVARVVGAERLEVRFNATVGAAAAATIALVSGDDQSASVGATLADPLVVRVSDGFGNPVAGVTVEWSAGQGSVDPGSSVTGEDGRAVTSWTLGSSAGDQSATASNPALEGSPVTFTGTAFSGSADRLVRVSGNGQSAQAGTELPDPLVVRLIDLAGNGVPNRAVSWVVATGGGSVSSANSTTDGLGNASSRWTVGPSAGANTLNAVVSGIGVVGFSATATQSSGGGGGPPPPPPPPPGSEASRLAFRVQPSDTEEGERISPPVEVVVLNQGGNLVTQGEFKIKLELTGSDDGKLKGHRDEKTRSGVAVFDDLKVDEEGDYRLRASTDGLPPVDSDEFEVEDD
ncbi:MAG: Ig-like domain-containing protein [Gemmatimonadales bacterium]